MPARLREKLGTALPGGERCRWPLAFVLSSAVHVCAILALAALSVSPAERSGRERGLDTRWASAQPPPPIETLDKAALALEAASEPGSASPGVPGSPSRAAGPSAAGNGSLPAVQVPRPVFPGVEADEAPSSAEGTAGASQQGEAGGGGEGKGFFGINEPGQRFVYVVDCSNSMNHPHDSPAKTRFRRLKFELIKSIGNMEPGKEFYIIFFNEEALPMPARVLQPARPQNKRRYLRWATKIRAHGKTDPRGAVALALRLRPDVIYFLTDGRFEWRTERVLEDLSQRRTAIHTFAMGNRDAEKLLQRIAERNNGEYHYIP